MTVRVCKSVPQSTNIHREEAGEQGSRGAGEELKEKQEEAGIRGGAKGEKGGVFGIEYGFILNTNISIFVPPFSLS